MADISLPPNIPERCVGCPGLEPAIDYWRGLTTLSDTILRSSLDMTTQELAALLPDGLVEMVGTVNNQPLSASVEADRTQAAKLMEQNNGQAYSMINEVVEAVEHGIQRQTYLCQGKGPMKVRLRPETGPVVLSVCRADAKMAHPGHPHQINAIIQKEQ